MKPLFGSALYLVALTISLAQAQPPQDAQPRRISIASGVLREAALKRVAPLYPPIAMAARASGKVEVQITISEEGKVLEATVISGHPLLREAAVEAAKQWVFKPNESSGVPVKVQGILTFNFELVDEVAELTKAIEREPGNAAHHLARGLARLSGNPILTRSHFEDALADFNQAIKLNPRLSAAYQQRGLILSRLGEVERALADFNRAVALAPADADAYLARGLEHYRRGRAAEAQRDFARCLAAAPQQRALFEAQIAAGKARFWLAQAMRNQLCAADISSRYGERARRLTEPFHPREITDRDDRAQFEACVNNGLEYIEKVLSFNPDNEDALFIKALLLRERQRTASDEAARQKYAEEAEILLKRTGKSRILVPPH